MKNFQAYHNDLEQRVHFPSNRGPFSSDEGYGGEFVFTRETEEGEEDVELSYTIVDGYIELDEEATFDFTKEELARAMRQAEREEKLNSIERAVARAGY